LKIKEINQENPENHLNLGIKRIVNLCHLLEISVHKRVLYTQTKLVYENIAS
jgi:hypothetical protein